MADVGIHIEGLPELQKIMQKVGSLQPVKTGLVAAAKHLKSRIEKYPPVSRRPMAQFWTDKQRRGFFYYLKRGKIEVPYLRGVSDKSEVHSKSWTIQASNGGLTQTVGSDTSYGPLVQDINKQTRYHRETGWKTIQEVKERTTREVNSIVKEVIDAALEGRNA